MSTQTAETDARVGPQTTLALGAVAALLALLATPTLAMGGMLSFVPGLILSVAAPGLFALVGLGAALQLYRLDRTLWGIALALTTVVLALGGTVFGLLSVF